MSDDFDQMGPVDYLVIEFPGSRLTGEGLPLLVDLVDRRIIRLLDMLFVKKLQDGSVTSLDIKELMDDERSAGGLGVFTGATSGLVGGDDLPAVADVLEPGSSAAIIVYENLWAAPLARALRRAGAQLVAGGRIPVQALLATLDALEADLEAEGETPERKG